MPLFYDNLGQGQGSYYLDGLLETEETNIWSKKISLKSTYTENGIEEDKYNSRIIPQNTQTKEEEKSQRFMLLIVSDVGVASIWNLLLNKVRN